MEWSSVSHQTGFQGPVTGLGGGRGDLASTDGFRNTAANKEEGKDMVKQQLNNVLKCQTSNL